MRPQLVKIIPGWSKLESTDMTKGNKLFTKVYQKVANYMRDEIEFFETVKEHRAKLLSGKTHGGNPESSNNSDIEDRRYGSDSADSEIQSAVAAQSAASKRTKRDPATPAKEEAADADASCTSKFPFDVELFHELLMHEDNPIQVAKRKLKIYRYKKNWWKQELKHRRKDFVKAVFDADSDYEPEEK